MHRLFKIVRDAISQIVDCIDNIPDDSYIYFKVEFDGFSATPLIGEKIMAELREGQEFTVTAAFKTRSNRPATYEAGTAVWETSNADVATVTANPDNELEAKVKGIDGSTNDAVVISFRADGDPDADVRELVATLDVVVTQGEAFVAELVAGPASDTPVEEPAPEESPVEESPVEEPVEG